MGHAADHRADRLERRVFGRRLILGLGSLVLFGGVLGQRRRLLQPHYDYETGARGCGKARASNGAPIAWQTDVDRAKAISKAETKSGLVWCGADWDNSTQMFEHESFADPDVRAIMHEHYVAVRLDMTDDDDPRVRPLQERFKVIGLPTLIIFGVGFERELYRFSQYVRPQSLLSFLIYAPEAERNEIADGR